MRPIEKLKVSIDRDECIGDGLCAEEAPGTFELDDDAKAIVLEGSTDEEEKILDAARACPVDCIIVENRETGEKLHPEE
ncbi:MAG: ferredoxin [Phycisphaerae bacterium]